MIWAVFGPDVSSSQENTTWKLSHMQFSVVHSALAPNIKTTPALKIVTPAVCAQLWWKFTQKVKFNTMQTSFCWAKEYLLLNVQKTMSNEIRETRGMNTKQQHNLLAEYGGRFFILASALFRVFRLLVTCLTCWCIYAIWDHCSRLLKHWKFASSFRIRTIKQTKKKCN